MATYLITHGNNDTDSNTITAKNLADAKRIATRYRRPGHNTNIWTANGQRRRIALRRWDTRLYETGWGPWEDC